jgi:RimJ/RimL family protein N-acetyltransferase
MHLPVAPLEGRFVRLEPFTQDLKDEVRSALDVDPEAWSLQTINGRGEGFEGWWAGAMRETARGDRSPFAVRRLADGAVVGTTSRLDIRPEHRVFQIGWTFYRPEVRGGVVNPECKLLLLESGFEAGAQRIELMVDLRNLRSQAAVLKLGAVKEGVLRRHKLTWTGHVRDTVVFSIVPDEWPAVRDRLRERVYGAVLASI